MVKYTTKSIQQQLHTPIIEKKNHKIFGIIDVRRSKLIKEKKKQEKVEKVKQKVYKMVILLYYYDYYYYSLFKKHTFISKKRINPKHYNR